uniref:Glycoprotein n=1 Tax=Parastrongyloides trichosuri TaxID=131310 RepID=A0A0N4Z943_PARTI
MNILTTIILLCILFGKVFLLQICPIVSELEPVKFPQVNNICASMIKNKEFIEARVYFIVTDFVKDSCTTTKSSTILLSPSSVINVETYTLYHRNVVTSFQKISCVPETAEYLGEGIYYIIEEIVQPNAFKLDEKISNKTCNKLVNDLSSVEGDFSEKGINFVRRVTGHDDVTGFVSSSNIFYAECNPIRLPIATKSLIESSCYNGTKIASEDGKIWYSKNGLDVIDKDNVMECLNSVNHIITESIDNERKMEQISLPVREYSPTPELETSTITVEILEEPHEESVMNSINAYIMEFNYKFVRLMDSLSYFSALELIFLLLCLCIFYSCIFFCIRTCCECVYYTMFSEETPNTSFATFV